MSPALPEQRLRAKRPGRCAKSGAGQTNAWAPRAGRAGGGRGGGGHFPSSGCGRNGRTVSPKAARVRKHPGASGAGGRGRGASGERRAIENSLPTRQHGVRLVALAALGVWLRRLRCRPALASPYTQPCQRNHQLLCRTRCWRTPRHRAILWMRTPLLRSVEVNIIMHSHPGQYAPATMGAPSAWSNKQHMTLKSIALNRSSKNRYTSRFVRVILAQGPC